MIAPRPWRLISEGGPIIEDANGEVVACACTPNGSEQDDMLIAAMIVRAINALE